MTISAKELKEILSKHLGVKEIHLQLQSGGCINHCYKVEAGNYIYFCKVNSASKFPQLFEVEAKGLEIIKESKSVKTPEVINIYYENDYQILLLEWIEEGEKTSAFWKNFGSTLAELHNVNNNLYGLGFNNYMGSVQQSNSQNETWTEFFILQRLEPLIALCKEKKLITSIIEQGFEKLYNKLPDFFNNVKPSLVHGDLWSGNFICNKNEEPVLIDPAVYYGIPAVDLGMTQLFGGFNHQFYQAYEYHYGFTKNQVEQNKICNFYPLLIHLFLFGNSYLPQIEETIKEFK